VIDLVNKSDRNLQEEKKSARATIKKKVIVLETKEDRDYLEECEEFLSKEKIHKIVSNKRCCKKDCLKVISPDYLEGDYRPSYNFVYLMRKQILGRTKQDRTKQVLELLEGVVLYYDKNFFILIIII
jgi:hypothetical protein